ncbi:MAG: crossover junction endodeoxyribonuclease RuvC [Verrucomicrobia bacterium]|nr:crossover junction endodeoxyribonuclease RuvC [Verrucomicrobiota bacterium]
MIILGIDPGTNVTGYGLIECLGNQYRLIDYGCIRPKQGLNISLKRKQIFEALLQLMEHYGVDVASVETQYVRDNPQTSLKLGMVRGVAILAASLRQIPVFEYAPRKAKLAVSGRGSATKAQVQWMVKRLLNLPSLPEPEDAADALALAICHANSLRSNLNLGTEI